MDVDIQQLLDEGITSLRIGNKEEARRKLMQVINTDERNELGLLTLARPSLPRPLCQQSPRTEKLR